MAKSSKSATTRIQKLSPALSLVPDPVSADCVDTLKNLLRQAESGVIVGVTYVAVRKKAGYIANTAGLAYDNPTFTLGMLEVLKEDIMQQMHARGR